MDRPDPEPTPAQPRRKRSRLRTALHVSHILALIGVAVLLLYVLALPVVVRHVVASTLADLGYPGATFRVRMASLNGVELADIRPAGAKVAVIHSALVRFSPIQVFRGKLRSIQLLGTEIPLDIHDGTVQFTVAPRTDGGSSSVAGGKPKPFPFERLDVAASTLRVNWEGRQIRLPLEGSLTPTPTGGRIALDTFFQGTTIPITGTIDSTGKAVDLSLAAANLSVAGIRSAVPWALMSYPFQTSGRVDLRLAYQLSGGRSVARVHVEPKNLWIAAQPDDHQLAVQHVSGSLDVDLLPGMRLGTASGTLRIGKVAWDDLTAGQIELAVRGNGDALEFEGALASEGWWLTSLKGTATGLNPSPAPLKVSADFKAKGYPPRQVADVLRRQGVSTDDLGELSVAGSVVYTLARPPDASRPWRLDVPALDVALDPGAVVLPRKGVTLAGVTASATLSGAIDPAGGSLMVGKGSRLSVGFVQTSGGYTLKPASARTSMVAADVADRPVSIAYRPQDTNGSWRVQVPRLHVSVGKTTVSDPAGGTNVEGVEGVLNLGGDVSGREVKMVTLADSWLGFGAATGGTSDAPVHVDAARFAVVPSAADAPLFGDAPAPRLNARLRATTPVAVTAGATKVTAKGLDVVAAADVSKPGGPAIRAEVAVDGAAVTQASWGLADVAARVPVSWNATGAAAAGEGSFTVGAVTVGEHKLPAVTGTVRVVNRSVAMTARSDLAKDATVTADANVEWTPAGMVGRAAAKLPSFRLDDAAAFGRVWKPATEIGLTGTFALDGQVAFNGPLIKPHITASVKDGKLTSKAYDLSIEGANGSVTIDNFDPISGPGRQRLTVDKLHVGKVDFAKGGVEFRVERPDSIHVERTRWGWVGGELYTYDVRVNPSDPQKLDAVVYADKLDLSQLLGLIASGEATGQGQLYGRLPVKLNWPQISFGQGFLYATGSGGINIGQKVDTVAGLLDQSDPRFASDPKMKEVKSRILDALRNFNYDTLKVDLIQKDGGLTASVTVNGKGGTGPTAQELDLTVNVNGIDQLLRQALIIKQALGGAGGS